MLQTLANTLSQRCGNILFTTKPSEPLIDWRSDQRHGQPALPMIPAIEPSLTDLG